MSGNRVGDATKKTLCESLKKKMAVKPVDKITIREIVEDCGMNRQTFYYHFEDIYDQMSWMYEQEILSLVRDKATADKWQDALLQLLLYMDENKAVTQNMIKAGGGEHLRHYIQDDIKGIVRDIIASYRDRAKLGEQPEEYQEYEEMFTHYLLASMAGLAESWARGEIKETPEKMVAFAETAVEDIINGVLLRANKYFDSQGKDN